MKQTTLISVQHLAKNYGEKVALTDVSLSLDAGNIVTVIGPNGSGKTTLLRSLIGLVKPTTGTVTVAGHDPAQEAYAVRRQVAFVPDEDDLPDWLTPREYLHFIAALYHTNTVGKAEKITQALALLELDEVANQVCGSFSHGMRKKVQLAGALVSDAKIIIVDEPTNGLDPDMIQLVRELLKQLRRNGRTMLIATHNLAFAAQLADRILVLRTKSYAFDTLPALLKQTKTHNLEDAYTSLTGVKDHAQAIAAFLDRYTD